MAVPRARSRVRKHADFVAMNRFLLWVAQGFGAGRIPFAPGTLGSLVGLLWMLALVASRSPWAYLLGMLAGVAVSVWLGGAAERHLGQPDPGSVVLDEIAAIPWAFAGWFAYHWWRTGHLPDLQLLLSGSGCLLLLAGFAAFRGFDIVKPWPVRQSQSLSGGWGITMDDVLAALYTNLIWVPAAGLGWL